MEKIDMESGKKLVPESAIPNSKDIEVKFIPPAPRNGDAKIDIDNLKSVFTGMGKEELMKYADDPFWVRLRWFLFILFWFIWVAMLAGAIGIIVLAPKCSSEPKSWWETSPTFKIDARAYASGKLKGIETKLDYIKSLGVNNILLTSVLKSTSSVDADDFTEDFESIDSDVGTSQEFDALIKTAKDKDMKVLLAFVPNHSSDKHAFFQKSVNKEEPYTNYYVWKPQNESERSGEMKNGGSEWTWNDIRKEFFLHRLGPNQPDFNFRNQSVVEYFKNVFVHWLNKGVSGFNLERVELMMEDMKSSSDASKITETDHFTIKSPELITILENWKSAVSNHSGVLTVNGLTSKAGNWEKLNPQPQKLSENFSAANLVQVVNSYLTSSSSWPVWQFSCTNQLKPEGCWKPEVTNGLQMVSILLPGTPLINAGEEISVGTIKPDPTSQTLAADAPAPTAVSDGSDQLTNADSPQKIFKKLTDFRSSPAFMHGNYEVKVLRDSVFVYTRIKSGSSGYLVAFNPTVETVEVNFSEMKNVPTELAVEAWSRPISYFSMPLKTKLTSNNVTITPGTALLCSFMPQI